MTFRDYPAPLQLNGRNLPYVTTCLHLGHILSQDGSMTQDCLSKRAQYIDKTVDIRNMFSFADPTQVLTAVDKYTSDYYGAMLYDLYDDNTTGKYFRCWGTVVKLAWNCPRSTHRYLVNNLLAAGFTSTRIKIVSRYIKFFHSLLKSSSKEVQTLASISAQDKSSNTGGNLARIAEETGLNPWIADPSQVKQSLKKNEDPLPERDKCRVPYLSKLIHQRYEMEISGVDTKIICQQIDSLCSS